MGFAIKPQTDVSYEPLLMTPSCEEGSPLVGEVQEHQGPARRTAFLVGPVFLPCQEPLG